MGTRRKNFAAWKASKAEYTERAFEIWECVGEKPNREGGKTGGKTGRTSGRLEVAQREHNAMLCSLLRLKRNITLKNPYACNLTS